MPIPYKYAVSLTAALGRFMAVLHNTIVNVALTAISALNTWRGITVGTNGTQAQASAASPVHANLT